MWLRTILVVCAVAAAAVPALAGHAERGAARAGVVVPAPALRFGIYPGGGVGMVLDRGAARAERPGARLDALRRLRPAGRDLVLHLYSDWTGADTPAHAVAVATAEVDAYTTAGFRVEPVLRYRPTRPRRGDDRAYAAHVRRVMHRLVANPAVAGVQIANEVNVAGAASAADGAYPRARAALVRGVVAAAAVARRAKRPDLGVGFNWAAAGNAGPDAGFWRSLRRLGGRSFARAVGWVGADIYPGTWSDRAATTEAGVARAMVRALGYLRAVALPRAGLGTGVALHVSENGFPTGAARDEAAQARLMRSAIEAVDRVRVRYGITDYRWFDLRDARTGRAGLENGYGVLRDDYSEKPGFAVLADLIRRLGA